jgi:hypothetical protein
MAKLILNLHSTFLIFPVLAIDQLFLYLFPIGWLDRLLCAFMIGAGESAIYIRIKKAAGWSPVRIHDVACQCALNYPHPEGAQFIVKRFHEENSIAPQIS